MVQGDKINQITVGGVTVSVWKAVDPPKSHHDDFTVEVGKPDDDNWVCVGGGGIGGSTYIEFDTDVNFTTNKGNYLTASFPSEDFKSWHISSRDHIVEYPIELIGYAIGMQIPNLDKEDLKANLKIFEKVGPSPGVSHPMESCFVDSEFSMLVGGGFKIAEPLVGGSLATGSFPDSTISWRAHAKDHDITTVTTVKVFAIGIRPILKKQNGKIFGNVITIFHSLEYFPSGSGGVVSPLSGFALCGGGAEVHYNLGRLLCVLAPTMKVEPPSIVESDQGFTSSDAFHYKTRDVGGSTTVYAMGIKFIPPQCEKPIKISEAKSSGNQDPKLPEINVYDDNLDSKWISTNISYPWIIVLLEVERPICRVDIAWADGDTVKYKFNIDVSTDNVNWIPVLTFGDSLGGSTDYESYSVSETPAKRVKITVTQTIPGQPGTGATAKISEIKVYSKI